MNISIENQQVIIELTEAEFSAFSAMFDNLGADHNIVVEGLEWPASPVLTRYGQTILPRNVDLRGPSRCRFSATAGSSHNGIYTKKILPMHLCRTIGEGRHRPTAEGSDQTILPRYSDFRRSPRSRSSVTAGLRICSGKSFDCPPNRASR